MDISLLVEGVHVHVPPVAGVDIKLAVTGKELNYN